MYFKYRKLIITTSCSIMLFGMVIFSTKNPIGMRAANVAESSNTTSVVKNESDVNSGSIVSNQSKTENVISETAVSDGEVETNGSENAKGVSILMKNAYPEVNRLIEDYYKARLEMDKDRIEELVDNISYAGIEELPKMMKNFESIKVVDCYTIDGPEDKAMMAYVKTETKFKGIDTPASGLDGFYIKPDENGDLKIILSPVSNEIQKIIDEDTKREDVVALLSDVNTKLAHEIKSDEKLASFFSKLKNRQAGSDEDINTSESKNKKTDNAKSSKKAKNKKTNKSN